MSLSRSAVRPGLAAMALLALLMAPACNPDDDVFGKSGGGSDDDTGSSTDDTSDTDTPDDTGGGEEELPFFDDPGDVVGFTDEQGDAQIDLSDQSGESNEDQEFFLVIVNTGTSDLGYQLKYVVPSEEEDAGEGGEGGEGGGGDAGGGDSGGGAPGPVGLSPFRQNLRDALSAGRLGPATPPPTELDSSMIGTKVQEFRVRNAVEDGASNTLVAAKLWALGDSVAIWVDEDVPIDWDYECDGTVDVSHAYDSYGFDNCDLNTVANIVDTNIMPNIRTLFVAPEPGEDAESDINGDARVSVVITPVLNYMTQSGGEDEQGTLVRSYADPEVDLNDYDISDNPGSNEQEVIFVFAPDPHGFYNRYSTASLAEYTSMELASQIARAFQRLVSYNKHVLEGGGSVEEAWLLEGLSALAADLTGFGAVYYPDVWDYMDAPHLQSLVVTDEEGAISTRAWGAQYLFLRWVVDTYGVEVLPSMVDTTTTGTSNVQAAVQAIGSAGATDTGGESVYPDISGFEDLVVLWHVAQMTAGQTNSDGEPLVEPTDFPPFAEASWVTAPTESPSVGDYYGANGYQMGLNIGGVNAYMEGGTTGSATENTARRVTLGRTDHLTMVTGFHFYGYMAADYGAQIVRLTDIPLDAAALDITSTGGQFAGVVVRWNDPGAPNYAVEDVFSSTDANNLELPDLPDDGSPIYGIGGIENPGVVGLIDADGDETEQVVYDTDRWQLDLTDRLSTESVDLAVTLSRHYEDSNGDIGLFDPWIAVVPSNLVPSPTVAGTARGECDDGGVDFAFPGSVLDYLYYQVFISSVPGEGVDDDFDPCGATDTADTTCADDWDRDGVLDADEPKPGTLLEQVRVMQCTLAGGDMTGVQLVTSEIIDWDELDDDDDAYYDRAGDLGGTSGGSGEEAFIRLTLDGGQRYLVIVGGGTDAGAYEFEAREVVE